MRAPMELIAAGIVAVLAGIGELYRRGKLKFRRKRTGRNGMNNGDRDTLENIHETVTHVDAQMDSVVEKVDRNAYLIRQFHGDEEVDVPVDRILDDERDFYRGGPSHPKD